MKTFETILNHAIGAMVLCAFTMSLMVIAHACEHDLTLSYDAQNETECDLTVTTDDGALYHLTAFDDGQCWYVPVNGDRS